MNNEVPSGWVLRFFRWFCREDVVANVEGDLLELYKERVELLGRRKADIKLVIDVLLLFRPGMIRNFEGYQQLNNYGMFKSYLKIGWRNLLKQKGYSAINIAGLAVGMTFAMLTGLWIHYETSFDSFHENGERIALILKNTLFNDERNTQDATPFPLSEELKVNYPEVKRASKVSWDNSRSLKVGDNTVIQSGRYVDPDFLEMFSFSLLKGDVKTALTNPNSIILTESLASSLFGSDSPMGKIVRVNDQFDVEVTGIIKDVPVNSTITFDFLAPYSFETQNSAFIKNNQTNWANNFLMNMVELREGVSMEDFSSKISKLNMEKDERIKDQFLFLHPLAKWRLYDDHKNWINTGGRIEYVRLFGIIGIFVLLIACINFMNLSTARSQHRAKEVGVRKTMGSQRGQLIIQFLSESMLTALLSFLVSICLILLVLPYLHDVGFANIQLSMSNSFLLIIGLFVCIATGLIAGSYPAFYLSSFLPVRVLKGIFRPGNGPVIFRRVLVITQFSISIGLIVSTIVVFNQVEYARSRPMGYNPDNLVSVEASRAMYLNYAAMKEDLLNSGYIEAVASTSSPMTSVYNKWSDFSWDGKAPDSQIAFEALMTEWDFEKVAGLKFKMGRPFSQALASDSNAVILNESALKIIGYPDPIGRTMKSGDREITIVGVVEDMLMLDPFKPVSPGVILFNAFEVNNFLIRIKERTDLAESLPVLRSIIERHNGDQPFTYSFVDDDFNLKFRMENQVGKLAGIFAVIAIFISCLGLFGLASFMAEQRVKEIGIRKILGATVSNLWRLLSRDFVIMVLVSVILAAPVTYYFMSRWLSSYTYRTEISGWIFVMVGAGVLLITLATVSYQALRAALISPVNSLRSE